MENGNAMKASTPKESRILADGLSEIGNIVSELRVMSAGVYLETKRLRSLDDRVETPQVEERVQISMNELSTGKMSDSLLESKLEFIKSLIKDSMDDLSSAAANIRTIV